MNIIASTSHPLRREQRIVAIPDTVPAPPPSEIKSLLNSTVGAVKPTTAMTAGWALTIIPNMASNDDIASILMKNNVPPAKAAEMAQEVRGFFGNPIVRTVVLAFSGGFAAYLVVKKTGWSTGTKAAIIIAAGLITGVLYLLLRHFGYQT